MWIGLSWLKAGPSHESNFRSICSQSFNPVQDYIHSEGKVRPYSWLLSFRFPVNIAVHRRHFFAYLFLLF